MGPVSRVPLCWPWSSAALSAAHLWSEWCDAAVDQLVFDWSHSYQTTYGSQLYTSKLLLFDVLQGSVLAYFPYVLYAADLSHVVTWNCIYPSLLLSLRLSMIATCHCHHLLLHCVDPSSTVASSCSIAATWSQQNIVPTIHFFHELH